MGIDIITLTASKKYTDKQIEKASIRGVDLSGYVQSVNGKIPDENGNVEISVSGGNPSYVGVEPAEDDIPKVFFGGALQQTKDEKVVSFRYISKTEDISGYAVIKAQGNSSMSYPKKNQTVKLFKDAECTEKLKVDFKGWGKQNKFCYKANWIDLTHSRNVVSARLWADVVKSRADYEELPELLRTSPNQGAVDGFPCKVYAGGVYQGRYTINIPKDKWMSNMDDDLDTHCILCGEGYNSGCFRSASTAEWTDEVHDSMPSAIRNRWVEVINFVMNSTDDEFKANLGGYFDVPSLIDYHLYGLISCGLDAYGKNQLYLTYDGQKWFASMYDMDSTWGLYWDGSRILPGTYGRTEYEDFVNGRQGNLLYIRLEQLFYEELQARWVELKNGVLSVANIINRFERFTDIAPTELVKEDYAGTTGSGLFTGIPSKTANNIQQIRAFALVRRAWTDTYVSELGASEPDVPDTPDEPEVDKGIIYSLPEPTTFNGVDTFVDTGVKLFDTAKDFTIVCTGDFSQGQTAGMVTPTVFHCVHETENWEGLSLNWNNHTAPAAASLYQFTNNNEADNNLYTAEDVRLPLNSRKFVVAASAGVITKIAWIEAGSARFVDVAHNVYGVVNENLILGAYQDTSGNKGRFWKGVLSDFNVYNYEMTDDEIVAYLGGEPMEPDIPDIPDEPATDETLLYKLPQPTIFNGVDDFIDTGVKLFDEDKDFTVYLRISDGSNNNEMSTVLNSMYEASPWPGFCVRAGGAVVGMSYGGARKRSFITHVAGNNFVTVNGNSTTSIASGIFDNTVILGCSEQPDGTKMRWWNGTIHACEIYSRAFTADEISDKFTGIEITPVWSDVNNQTINPGTGIVGAGSDYISEPMEIPSGVVNITMNNANGANFGYLTVFQYDENMGFIRKGGEITSSTKYVRLSAYPSSGDTDPTNNINVFVVYY